MLIVILIYCRCMIPINKYTSCLKQKKRALYMFSRTKHYTSIRSKNGEDKLICKI